MVNKKVLFWTIVIYFSLFQRVFTSISNIFSYFDEIFAILVCILLIARAFRKELYLSKSEKRLLIALFFCCVIGVVSNFESRLLNSTFLIIVDFISSIKIWLAYYVMIITNYKKEVYDELIMTLAKVARVLIIIMFIFYIPSQLFGLGMVASQRYGVMAYRFIYNTPGNFSKVFYFIIPLLTADLFYGRSKYKTISIILALFIWATTLRGRAFSFIAFYLLTYFAIFKGGRVKTIKIKNLILLAIPILIITIMLSYGQIERYFTNERQARFVLLKYGIITMLNYFPLGAGFGTFGSDVAATNYSKLYYQYKVYKYYGMGPNKTSFLNDNYWPMIMGQFGAFGVLLTIYMLWCLLKTIHLTVRSNPYHYGACMYAISFLILSSVASKSFCEFSTINVFLLIAIIVKRSRLFDNEV